VPVKTSTTQQAQQPTQTNQAQQKKKGVIQKAKDLAKAHPKAIKAAIITLQVVTIASAFFDDGLSAAALPEEEGLEAEATAIEDVTTPGSDYGNVIEGGAPNRSPHRRAYTILDTRCT
jgi:hypothetical protein